MTKVELDAIDNSTTLESNKSQDVLASFAPLRGCRPVGLSYPRCLDRFLLPRTIVMFSIELEYHSVLYLRQKSTKKHQTCMFYP